MHSNINKETQWASEEHCDGTEKHDDCMTQKLRMKERGRKEKRKTGLRKHARRITCLSLGHTILTNLHHTERISLSVAAQTNHPISRPHDALTHKHIHTHTLNSESANGGYFELWGWGVWHLSLPKGRGQDILIHLSLSLFHTHSHSHSSSQSHLEQWNRLCIKDQLITIADDL